jgi:hypothetical protein
MNQKSAIIGLVALSVLSTIATFSLMDHTKADWFQVFWGIVGTNLSILGIIYTWVQIALLRHEAEIIRSTTNDTQERIKALNRFGDVATAMKLIQEIQSYTRARKYEPGVMRLQELKIIIGQMKSFNSGLQHPLDLDGTIVRLNQLINAMEKDIDSRTASLKVAAANASLERILDTLVHIQTETLQRN